MDAYLLKRQALIRDAEPGLASARQLSALTDTAVSTLSTSATPPPERWAVCALGGWGAGALLPASDLDILVLSDAPERSLKPFVEAMLYPLWDAGLKVGHQVRRPKDHLSACRHGDIETLTASLTARTIAGDATFGDAVLARVAAQAQRSARPLLRRLAERPRHGSPFLLEPDLKHGAGGRRDYDELTWSAAILAGSVSYDAQHLLETGHLTPNEFAELTTASQVIAQARWCLHIAGERDLMSLDAADALPDPERTQHALATTWLVLNRARRRFAGRTAFTPASTPQAVFALLDGGSAGIEELEEAAFGGQLDDVVPGLRPLMVLRRPGLAHMLTVGAHCVKTAALVADLGSAHGPVARSAELVTDVRVLQAAALLHDAGKLHPGPGHAERGAQAAADASGKLGLESASAEEVRDLVRLHLALAETAMHEDLDDEEVILCAAARIGKRELVAPLHVLTAADTLATGPSASSPWFEALVARLVARVDSALSPDEDGAGLVSRAAQVRGQALAALTVDADAERAFVEAAPARYLSSRTAAEAVRDARLVTGLSAIAAAEQARIIVSAGPAADTSSVTIAAWDRPDLLSRMAGAFTLAGLDILGFDAHGVTGDIALDSFVVRSATQRHLEPEVFTRLERLLELALKDRYELATRLAERRRHYRTRPSGEPSIEVRSGGWDTVVRITAADRPGLLHDLAGAVSTTGLDIRWARARMLEGTVHDTFHVVGPDGGPVDDPGILGHLAMRLRNAVGA